MHPDDVQELARDWNKQANDYERDGAFVDGARVLRRCADQLQAALQEWWTEPLTAEQAAEVCPWKASTIRRKIGGKLPDAGEPYRPRVRRCDLLAAFTDAPDSPEIEGPDPAEEVLAGMESS